MASAGQCRLLSRARGPSKDGVFATLTGSTPAGTTSLQVVPSTASVVFYRVAAANACVLRNGAARWPGSASVSCERKARAKSGAPGGALVPGDLRPDGERGENGGAGSAGGGCEIRSVLRAAGREAWRRFEGVPPRRARGHNAMGPDHSILDRAGLRSQDEHGFVGRPQWRWRAQCRGEGRWREGDEVKRGRTDLCRGGPLVRVDEEVARRRTHSCAAHPDLNPGISGPYTLDSGRTAAVLGDLTKLDLETLPAARDTLGQHQRGSCRACRNHPSRGRFRASAAVANRRRCPRPRRSLRRR